MGLEEQLAKARGRLRNCECRVTDTDGAVFVERRSADGQWERQRQGTALGFVVNTEPDLQVGVVRPWLCVGSQDAAHDLSLLQGLGVTHVLNVATGVRNPFRQQLKYLDVPMLDVPWQKIADAFPAAFEFIEATRRSGGRCLVHCNAGVSRSAAVVLGYLMQFEGISYTEALEQTNAARRVRPNPGFRSQLFEFERQLNEKRKAEAS